MKLRQIIRDYFTFTKNERVGLAILLVLIIIVLLANKFIYYFETPATADREMFQQLLADMAIQQKMEKEESAGELFNFNPNTIDSVQLTRLALPAQVKRNLLKYRRKGGRFYAVSDFSKIYGMNDSVYTKVSEFIRIDRIEKKNFNRKTKPKDFEEKVKTKKLIQPDTVKNITFELNTATADDLIKLNGIGTVLSKRIVKYRKLLGGFLKFDQLREVYGLKPETIEKILPYLNLDTTLLEQINVNFAEASQLVKHPYIDWELANALVNFRSENGFINEIQILQKNGVCNESDYQRISPYLKTKD